MKLAHGLVVAMVCLVGTAVPVAVNAAGGAGGDFGVNTQPADPDYSKGVKAVEAKRWDEANQLFLRALSRDDKNADILNYLGYTERNRGNMDNAFKYYEKALALNPKHRGAHEYLGEAYLMTGNLPKAEEQLAALDKLCFFSCEEYRELKEKIAEYKKK